jgi:DNA-directed RNA polymerase subunit H (RpoH/RPB5)
VSEEKIAHEAVPVVEVAPAPAAGAGAGAGAEAEAGAEAGAEAIDIKTTTHTKSSISTATRYPTMNDNFVLIDNLYRSRLTLLDILEQRGYEVEPYRKFSPAEAAAAAGSFTGLSFQVTLKTDANKVCHVRYENISQQKLKNGYFPQLVSDEDSERTEMIMMMTAHVTDTHHMIALKEYMRPKEQPNEKGVKDRRKLRISFFSIDALVINPLRHVLVPKHELVPEEQHKELMGRLHALSKSKFPEIKFHIDPIARCIGAVPGDIVKITRPSASAGEAIIYRVCAP